jgi:hypothetical protein
MQNPQLKKPKKVIKKKKKKPFLLLFFAQRQIASSPNQTSTSSLPLKMYEINHFTKTHQKPSSFVQVNLKFRQETTNPLPNL